MDINIKDDGVYDIKEVNELTKIPIRNLQRIALRRNLEKAGKSYIFTGADIKDLWLNTVSPPKDTATPPKELAVQLTKKTSGATLNIADLQNLKLDDIEDFEFKFRRPGEFPKEGSFVFIPSEYDFAEYRPGEYADAEEKLQEWQYQKQELIDQKVNFERLIKSQREQKEFYKGQVEYYQKLASKTLGMQSTLIETLSNQTKSNFIESTIRAKNTEWKKGTEPNKKGK